MQKWPFPRCIFFLFNLCCAALGKTLVLISLRSLQPSRQSLQPWSWRIKRHSGMPSLQLAVLASPQPLCLSSREPSRSQKFKFGPFVPYGFQPDSSQQPPSWLLGMCQCPETIPFFAGLPHLRKILALDPVMQRGAALPVAVLIQVGEDRAV